MKTSWFTFKMGQKHKLDNNVILDHKIILKITHQNPRDYMFHRFGCDWDLEYCIEPKGKRYTRGVYNLNNNQYEMKL